VQAPPLQQQAYAPQQQQQQQQLQRPAAPEHPQQQAPQQPQQYGAPPAPQAQYSQYGPAPPPSSSSAPEQYSSAPHAGPPPGPYGAPPPPQYHQPGAPPMQVTGLKAPATRPSRACCAAASPAPAHAHPHALSCGAWARLLPRSTSGPAHRASQQACPHRPARRPPRPRTWRLPPSSPRASTIRPRWVRSRRRSACAHSMPPCPQAAPHRTPRLRTCGSQGRLPCLLQAPTPPPPPPCTPRPHPLAQASGPRAGRWARPRPCPAPTCPAQASHAHCWRSLLRHERPTQAGGQALVTFQGGRDAASALRSCIAAAPPPRPPQPPPATPQAPRRARRRARCPWSRSSATSRTWALSATR
jgi:hypothetical protein